jgi:hypothetical protein
VHAFDRHAVADLFVLASAEAVRKNFDGVAKRGLRFSQFMNVAAQTKDRGWGILAG